MTMIYTNPEIDIRIFELEKIGTTEGNGAYASYNAYTSAQKSVADKLGESSPDSIKSSYIFTF
ncbi:MAG: hypothetical protein ACI4TH_02265 [Candidatus Ornithomonoglobus sp.]